MLPDFLCRPLILIFGMLYPGYMSYKALKKKRSTNYGVWLMYWITFSLFTSFEIVTDIFIGPWLPFYNELKLLLLYMVYPTSDTALTYMYSNIISPLIKKHEKYIDSQIKNFKNSGSQSLAIAVKKMSDVIMKFIFNTIQSYGLPIGPFYNTNMNMNTNMNIIMDNENVIENDEPDGHVFLEEINDDSDDDTDSSKSVISCVHEYPEYTVSEIYYEPVQTDNFETKYDPPASNTRRRRKAQ